ncbi:uncharacterized protein LOC113495913 [Trichoplusia ni]|uniref:Uncharacterized protein LOC113495913 n=1 Tax=Trichoplusia ni TaxID=7111 RepID=A0A7E5VR36_TRINI|nr:uncharacterized protein LOC113495913 [Trichoplusia ni]
MMMMMMRTMTKNKMTMVSKMHKVSKSAKTNKRNMHKVTKTIITSPHIYKPVGPYSQAILTNNTLYISGVLGLDAQAKMVCGIEEQTKQVMENMKHVLKAGGASLESVIKTTILLARIEDFPVVNKIYGCYFKKHSPARATFQVGKLPLGADVEIEAIALSGDLEIKEGAGDSCSQPDPCSRKC